MFRGSSFTFTNNSGDDNIQLEAGQGETLVLNGSVIDTSLTDTKMLYSNGGTITSAENVVYTPELTSINNSFALNGNLQYITQMTDLPVPIAGVINLVPSKSYIILGAIDLLGDRLECSGITVIKGTSSEVSFITSTGLGIGIPLLTTVTTTVIQNITFQDIDTCLNISGNGDPNIALDWDKFNIINCPNIGTIENTTNFLLTNSAFLNSTGLIFDGTVGTIGFINSLFTNITNGTSITISATATVSRRLKIIDSSMVTTGTGIAVNFSTSATVPNQSFLLSTCNFSGGSSTYLVGVQSDDNKALFFNCLGIRNSRSLGDLYLSVPVLTTIAVINTWYKILGTTVPSANNSKFTHQNNRLTYTGNLDQIAIISFTVALSGSNGNVIDVGIAVDGNDPTTQNFSTTTTLDSAGKESNMSLTTSIEIFQNEYYEIWVRNRTNANDVTATSLNVSIVAQV